MEAMVVASPYSGVRRRAAVMSQPRTSAKSQIGDLMSNFASGLAQSAQSRGLFDGPGMKIGEGFTNQDLLAKELEGIFPGNPELLKRLQELLKTSSSKLSFPNTFSSY